VRYAAIREHEGVFAVTTMCRALAVSRSGYYGWRSRAVSERARTNARLLDRIRRIHAQSRENYGVRKIWRALVASGERCGRHRVARLCSAHGIAAKRMRRFRSVYRSEQRPAAPNLLQRHFRADRADRLWAGDMTFIPTREGWLYLAVLIDLYSRRVVGWAMGSKMNQALANDALIMAIKHRKPKPGLIHHTDRGVLYGTTSYTIILNHHGMIQSQSRKGDCYDNAVVESFFANLKNELTWHCRFTTRDEAKAAVFDYIEVFYNRQRLHETLDYASPVRYEERVVT
jgi:transposase InsO family protein